MRWEVVGADKNSGKDVVRIYEANSEEAAALLAKGDGILVSSIDLLVDMDSPTPSRASLPTVSPIAYATPKSVAPQYAALSILGHVLAVYAILCYIGGGLLLIFATIAGVAGLANAGNSQGGGAAALVVIIGSIAPAFAAMFAGLIAHAFGSGLHALRDIARNSWR